MSEDPAVQNENSEATSALPVISPAKRKQLQKTFDLGMQKHNQKNYDYATELLLA